MRLRNLTNSPYAVPLKEGGEQIIPANDVAEVDVAEGYPIDPAFWSIEEDIKPKSAKVFIKEEKEEEDEDEAPASTQSTSRKKNRNRRR